MRHLLVILLLPICLSAAERGLPLPQHSAELSVDPAVGWGRLDNGLVWALRSNAEPPGKLAIRLYVDAGSLQETDPERGLAHFLEHMAFNGTEHYPPGTLIETLQELGAAFGSHTNAHTGFEETVYKLDLPDASAETLDVGLTIMADWARGMLILPDEVERERGVILAEMRDRDGAQIRTWRKLYAALYAGRRVAERFPIGTAETVAAMDADLLRGFYDRWYRPEAMVLAVVGDLGTEGAVDLEACTAMIAERFGDLSAPGEAPTWEPLPLEASEELAVAVHVEAELGDTDLRLMVVSDREQPADSVAQRKIDLLRSVAGSVLSRRFADLADDEAAPIQSGAAYAYQRMDAFHGVAGVTARPGRALDAVPVLEHELRRFLEYGPTAAELELAAATIGAQLDQAVAKAANRTNAQLAGAIYASVRDREVLLSPEQRRELYRPWLDELEPEAVRAALAEAFDGARRVLTLTGREDLGDDAAAQLRSAWTVAATQPVEPLAEVAAATWAYATAATPPAPVEAEVLDHGIHAAELANGVGVMVLPRDAKPGEVVIQLRLHAGLEPLWPGLPQFTAMGFMAGGLGAHDAPELRRVLAGTTAGVSGPSYDGGDVVFSASCQPHELALCLQQLRAWLTDPGWRAKAYDRAHAAWLESISANRTDLDTRVGERWSLLTAGGYPQNGPVGYAQAAWLHLGVARAWLQPILNEAPIELALVGDVEAADALATINAELGVLPARPPVPVTRDLDAAGALAPIAPLPTGTARIEVDGSVARAKVIMGWPTDDAGDVHRARRLSLLAQVVDELMRRRIREELGEAYSPYARNSSSLDFEGRGQLRCVVGVAPGREDVVVELLRELVADLVAEGIPDDVFNQVHTPTVANLAAYRHGNGYWLGSVVAQARSQPQRLAWAAGMEADFASITKDDLEALAERHLRPEHELCLIAVSPGPGDEASAQPGPEGAAAP